MTILIKYLTVLTIALGYVLVYTLWQNEYQLASLATFLFFLLASYMRFVEPQFLHLHHQKIKANFKTKQTLKIVLIADPHLGPFKGAHFLKRVVNKINHLNPDLVLIAGDFLFRPTTKSIPKLLAPLALIKAPTYAVSGNHDYDKPHYINLLKKHLPSSVNFIDDQIAHFKLKETPLTLIGLSDLWHGTPQNHILKQINPDHNTIILIHNPDHLHYLPPCNANLVVAGHTHGGQIRIPYLYKKVIPCEFDHDWGHKNHQDTQLFTTSGLGETALPMRFLRPPQINVLTLE